MASNKRINKAYIRYDGTGRVIAGALLLNRFKPKGGGQWHEIPAYECCNPSPIPAQSLRLLFSNIEEIGAIVGDVNSVTNWNTFFDLPTYGNPFTSVVVVGNEVKLYGGSNIIIKEMLFDQPNEVGIYLLEIDDLAGSIIEVEYDGFGYDNNSGCNDVRLINLPAVTIAGDYAFSYCGLLSSSITISLPALITVGYSCFINISPLVSISLPLATSIGDMAFSSCTSLETINLSSCTNLGTSVSDNSVFQGISGNNVSLTVPTALMTADAGQPDGDIQYLQANNTVTVVTV